jgi:2-phosphoglycerate kinase
MCKLRVILIGGSSHIGKSTLAESLAIKLGWRHISTDSLARHPGRPWRTKPESLPLYVAEHYLSLSTDALIEDVLRHYRNMWPNVESIITAHATHHSTEQLILEGSALWPEFVAILSLDKIAAIWLTASNDFFQARIHKASQFEEATVQRKVMIQKFLERTHLYNEQMMDAIKRLGLVSINVETTASLNELSDICLKALSQK